MLPQTGQFVCYGATWQPVICTGTGQDGEFRWGAEWPAGGRYRDNFDQTVTDRLTGLEWTANGNHASVVKTWQQALAYVVAMNSANGGAGTHGHNDWRLPNVRELASLIDRQQGFFNSHLSGLGVGFFNIQPDGYWTATTAAADPAAAWYVNLSDGGVYDWYKTDTFYVWPVRGGQTGAGWISSTGQTLCYDGSGQPAACSGTGQDGETRTGVAEGLPRAR